jgi:Transcriptional regulator PadR-like family
MDVTKEMCYPPLLIAKEDSSMTGGKSDVLQGTLDLMVLKTLEVLGPLHGYGIARRIEQLSEQLLRLNESTVYAPLVGFLKRLDSTRVGAVLETSASRGSTRSRLLGVGSWLERLRIGNDSEE